MSNLEVNDRKRLIGLGSYLYILRVSVRYFLSAQEGHTCWMSASMSQKDHQKIGCLSRVCILFVISSASDAKLLSAGRIPRRMSLAKNIRKGNS